MKPVNTAQIRNVIVILGTKRTELVIRYDTIRYDSGYLTCSKKLTGSQLSLPHGTNKK